MINQVQNLKSDDQSMTDRESDIITDFAAGNLSPAKHALVSCAMELNPSLAKAAAFETNIAAVLMNDAKSQALSPLLIEETLKKLPSRGGASSPSNDNQNCDIGAALVPPSLSEMIDKDGFNGLEWRKIIPGLMIHDLIGDHKTTDGERLFLLKAESGVTIPEHSHVGEEWSLILKGAYMADERSYNRGDLHIEDASTEHAPTVVGSETCICLVVTEGPLDMKRWIPRLFQKFIGF